MGLCGTVGKLWDAGTDPRHFDPNSKVIRAITEEQIGGIPGGYIHVLTIMGNYGTKLV